MPGTGKYSGSPHALLIECTCTSIGGGNTTLPLKGPDVDSASTIVVNGNASAWSGVTTWCRSTCSGS
jgi:hypothetical protein